MRHTIIAVLLVVAILAANVSTALADNPMSPVFAELFTCNTARIRIETDYQFPQGSIWFTIEDDDDNYRYQAILIDADNNRQVYEANYPSLIGEASFEVIDITDGTGFVELNTTVTTVCDYPEPVPTPEPGPDTLPINSPTITHIDCRMAVVVFTAQQTAFNGPVYFEATVARVQANHWDTQPNGDVYYAAYYPNPNTDFRLVNVTVSANGGEHTYPVTNPTNVNCPNPEDTAPEDDSTAPTETEEAPAPTPNPEPTPEPVVEDTEPTPQDDDDMAESDE